ncbi:MAG: trypsin-like peptidase domain-containing protein [Planctomycetes bacterium]|nr:trypsin-like peptidase domain-containing protein [Planctomycetota bacterium]
MQTTRDSMKLGRARAARLFVCAVAGGCLAPVVPARAQSMPPETLERVKKASVMVWQALSKRSKGDTKQGSGTGYFINRTGLAITNNHVVDPAHRRPKWQKDAIHYSIGQIVITVITDAGTDDEKEWEAIRLYQNEWADQALLQVIDEDGENLETPDYLEFLPESQLKMDMPVWAFGFPDGQRRTSGRGKSPEVTVTRGRVVGLPVTPSGRLRMIHSDVSARPGNSGGPAVSREGMLVGTVTVMASPDDREDFGGGDNTGLVPARITAQVAALAYRKGDIPDGSDFAPFVTALTNDEGRISIPQFQRWETRDMVFLENGDRIPGNISTESITWDSPLGSIEVSTRAIAYVTTDDDGSNLYLEGGSRIASSDVTSSFKFEAVNGEKTEMQFEDIMVVGFRKEDRAIAPVKGKVILFEADVARLVLSSVTGTTTFETEAGDVEVDFNEIVRIDINEDDDNQRVSLLDGTVMSGDFSEDDMYTGIIAATEIPIKFNLSEVGRATIELTEIGRSGERVAGLDLQGVMAKAGKSVRSIVDKIKAGNIESARARIDRLMRPEKFKKMGSIKKDRLRLLDGIVALREGRYKEANTALRKAGRSKDENVSGYASSFSAVLKRFGTEYKGKPLSDPTAVVLAGEVVAKEVLHDIRRRLSGVSTKMEAAEKGEYKKALTAVSSFERKVRKIAVFGGEQADLELARLYRHGMITCTNEILRIYEEIRQLEDDARAKNQQPRRAPARRGRGRGRGGAGAGNRLQRETNDLQEQVREAITTYYELYEKHSEMGFILPDNDLQRMVEAEAEADEDDHDDDKP